jgi:hypothetical protein
LVAQAEANHEGAGAREARVGGAAEVEADDEQQQQREQRVVQREDFRLRRVRPDVRREGPEAAGRDAGGRAAGELGGRGGEQPGGGRTEDGRRQVHPPRDRAAERRARETMREHGPERVARRVRDAELVRDLDELARVARGDAGHRRTRVYG